MPKACSTNLKGEDSPVAAKAINQTRLLLLTGFGGILLLLAVLGLYGLSTLSSIQERNRQIRSDYVQRNQILEQLRSELYLSGTYVRDLLIEPDPQHAAYHRRDLERSRSLIRDMVTSYNQKLRLQEQSAFGRFKQKLDAYFDLLEPAANWDAAQRRLLGYAFMQQELLPRRMLMVRLADELRQVNENQLAESSRQVDVLFDDFRRRFVLLLALTFSIGLALAGVAFYRVLRLERDTADRFREVEVTRSALQDLSSRLVEAQENERKALSRELHDEVGQALSGVLFGIANLTAILPAGGDGKPERELQKLRRLTEKTVATVRDMSLLLRPSMLDDLGLLPALEWQAREASRVNGLNVTVAAARLPEDLSEDQKTCIYRVVQEALRNVSRHARATAVEIHLDPVDDRLLLTIEDNGSGFNPAREKGLGLLGMEERVKHLGGSFTIQSQPGRGSRLSAEVPLAV